MIYQVIPHTVFALGTSEPYGATSIQFLTRECCIREDGVTGRSIKRAERSTTVLRARVSAGWKGVKSSISTLTISVLIVRFQVVLATWHIRSEIRHFESDLLVPFCLQERSGKGRIREHVCISSVGTFLSLRKGEACVPCSHPSQATNSALLSRALRWHCSLDEAALHLPSTWNDRRPCQREVRTACRKRIVTAATHYPTSASQTTSLQEDRYVPLVASGEDDFGLGSRHS